MLQIIFMFEHINKINIIIIKFIMYFRGNWIKGIGRYFSGAVTYIHFVSNVKSRLYYISPEIIKKYTIVTYFSN